jgi:hypothetical protein
LYWEHAWPQDVEPPEQNIEQFIRAKYERKQYAMPGAIPDPDTLGPRETPTVVAEKVAESKQNPVFAAFQDFPQSSNKFAAFQDIPQSTPSNSSLPLFKAFDSIPSKEIKPSVTANLPSFAAFGPNTVTSPAKPTQQDIKSNILSLYANSPSQSTFPTPVVVKAETPVTFPPSNAGTNVNDLAGLFGNMNSLNNNTVEKKQTNVQNNDLFGLFDNGNVKNVSQPPKSTNLLDFSTNVQKPSEKTASASQNGMFFQNAKVAEPKSNLRDFSTIQPKENVTVAVPPPKQDDEWGSFSTVPAVTSSVNTSVTHALEAKIPVNASFPSFSSGQEWGNTAIPPVEKPVAMSQTVTDVKPVIQQPQASNSWGDSDTKTWPQETATTSQAAGWAAHSPWAEPNQVEPMAMNVTPSSVSSFPPVENEWSDFQ